MRRQAGGARPDPARRPGARLRRRSRRVRGGPEPADPRRDVVVIRYEGPKGAPGMPEMLGVTAALVGQGLGGSVAADHRRPLQRRHARLHGRARRPEAASGGPIALVREGDPITIDVKARRLDVDAPSKRAGRRSGRKPRAPPPEPSRSTPVSSRPPRTGRSPDSPPKEPAHEHRPPHRNRHPPRARAARLFADELVRLGVTHVFGHPGGTMLPLYDALYDTPAIKHLLVRHEQCGAHAAEGTPGPRGAPASAWRRPAPARRT